MSLRVEQGNILLPTAWKPDLFWPDRNKTELWNGKTKAFYLTFAWQKSVGKNTSRWSYVTKSATPKLMKKNLLEGSIQFLIILIKNYEKLYGALRDTYSASPVCLLHAVSFIYFWLQFFFQILLVASVHHQPSSVLLNFETLSSNSFDKSVGDKRQNVCWKVSVVFTSRITFSFNLVPLYTTVSKNIVSVNFGGEFNSRIT